jgi:hypothetical protein
MKNCILLLLFAFSINLSAQNVGIGTSMPDASAKLDVVDANRGLLIPRVALTATNASGPVTSPATSLLVYNTAIDGTAPNNVWPGFYYWNGTKWVRLDTGNGDWKLDGNNNGVLRTIGTKDNFDFPIETNGTEKMRITAGGDVGIGTTAPGAKLHVHGGFINVSRDMPAGDGNQGLIGYELTNSSAGDYWRMYLADPDGGFGVIPRAFEIWEYPANLGSGACCRARLRIMSSDGLATPSEVVINSAGNVGIGTTNPLYKLDVYDNSDAAFIRVRANLVNNGTHGSVGLIMSGSDQGWTIYQGDPDGGFGVGQRNFEIWEYPANPGGAGQCCRRRFVIENTFGLNTGLGPTNLILQNNGNVCSYGSFVSCSDVRLKKDFAKLDNILNKILTINTYYFHWNTSQFPEKFNDTTRQIGIKAQEIKELFPELVSQDSEGFYQVAYDKLSVLAIQSIKEQQKQIQEQQQQIQDQQKIIQQLQEENFKIKQANLQLKEENNQIKAEMKLLNEKVDNLINSLSNHKTLVTTE